MPYTLEVSQLYHTCNSSLLSFETTQELQMTDEYVWHKGAIEAVDFSANIEQDGYNLFAMGTTGSGKFSTIMSYLKNKAKNGASPSDWCYVNNFKDPKKPIAIQMPSGLAFVFKDDMYELIELLKGMLPAVFESNSYNNELEAITKKYVDKEAEIFEYLQEEAKKYDVAMNSASRSRVTFAPVIDSKILTAEEYNAIKGEEKENIKHKIDLFEKIVKEQLQKVSELSKAQQKEFRALERKITQESVESLIDEIRNKYSDFEKITEYLNALQNDVVRHVKDFLVKPEEMGMPPFIQEYYTPSFSRYKVNLLISHEKNATPPVIFEDNPIHQNLIGAIEHVSQVGTLVTDFSMIKPGALHKANGGYLILHAKKLLMQPFAYEELKRALHSKEIRIESLAQQYSFISTTTLEPEPIPLNIKIVLIGERILYYLLYQYDPDFQELFKVNADFEDEIPRSDDNIQLYAKMIGTMAKRDKLLPLTPEAVARVIEQSSREVSHSTKVSTHLRTLSDLLKEADYWSKKNNKKVIDADDVNQVLHTRMQRHNRIQMRLYELIDEGTIMINVKGSVVGQINALSYISMGGYSFGIASRITARTRIGKGEVIDIERKVELGGPLHSKGVMILSSYLGSTYSPNMPLSLWASLVFEQSYNLIDGDSASSTELYAILSSLSGLAIKQNIAVTGSINQFGEIQPIGGVNEKIEGFFDICMRQDPQASYGVIIPYANVKHLMLKEQLQEAVKNGIFTIYAVKTVNDGISILTGVEAGEVDAEGEFPPSCVNGLITAKLRELSKISKEFNSIKRA
ncbi:AAA family ATPase [Candidatus Sulfurimonas marisnigri]|uniref:endopeptidase La n=1 Tax=Candidatus Sulfurimonas marisnigri TaxID=2740405 RepID=A0A7S7LYQ3_9BACT|nr:ATP-binding protein [Candidatus Sulfurimonas marisnigri]QOY53842.1 AAA family ATPase [Candidatus Sulfurimonas marisnigri]